MNLKGLDYTFKSVHLLRDGGEQRSDSYAALNPQKLVPTLEVDGRVLTQSPAILEWLDETYPDPKLLPADAFDRAAVRAFCAAIACEIHPLQNLRVLQHIEANFGADAEGKKAWCQRWIGDGLKACEGLLQARPKSEFCFGDTPAMAEVYLMPQVFSALRFGVNIEAFPRLFQAYKACETIPAFKNAHPSVQPDAE